MAFFVSFVPFVLKCPRRAPALADPGTIWRYRFRARLRKFAPCEGTDLEIRRNINDVGHQLVRDSSHIVSKELFRRLDSAEPSNRDDLHVRH